MTEEQKQQIAKQADNAVAKQTDKPKGFEEGTDHEDLIIPRVKLVQKTSQEMDDDGLSTRPGELINSLTKAKYEQPLLFVPVCRSTFYARYNAQTADGFGYDPAYEPGALIYKVNTKQECWNNDAEWTDGRKPLAHKYINYLSYLPDYPDFPVIIGFSKTSLKAGQEIYSILKLSGCNMFERMFALTTFAQEKNDNKYYVMKSTLKGTPDTDVIKHCNQLFDNLAPKAQGVLNQSEQDIPWED